jgi:hypothetical protein
MTPPVDQRTVAVARKFSYLLCSTSELAYELRQQGYHQWVSARKADWDWRVGGCSWTGWGWRESIDTYAARRQLGWLGEARRMDWKRLPRKLLSCPVGDGANGGGGANMREERRKRFPAVHSRL